MHNGFKLAERKKITEKNKINVELFILMQLQLKFELIKTYNIAALNAWF